MTSLSEQSEIAEGSPSRREKGVVSKGLTQDFRGTFMYRTLHQVPRLYWDESEFSYSSRTKYEDTVLRRSSFPR